MINKKSEPPSISDLDVEELDALMVRLQEAIEFELALSTDDIRLLLSAVMTLATMQERLSSKDVTVHKLRKLLGMVQASEKLSHLLGEDKREPKKHKPLRTKKKATKKTIPPVKVHHKLDGLNKGDRCPECNIGTLYKYEPAQLLRITGHTPYTPERHLSERLRCNACNQFFTATLSGEVVADGGANQK